MCQLVVLVSSVNFEGDAAFTVQNVFAVWCQSGRYHCCLERGAVPERVALLERVSSR